MTQPEKATTSQIVELLLSPLGELFGDLGDRKRPIYINALRSYTVDELKRCYVHLRDTYEPKSRDTYPAVSVIHKARIATDKSDRNSAAPGQYRPFKEQIETQERIVADYLRQFEQDQLYQQARSAGWHNQLMSYVREAANVQAQMIVPTTGGIGYRYATLFAHIDRSSNKSVEQAKRDFFAECKRHVAETGRIGVTIPREAIDCWQQFSASMARSAGGIGYPCSPPSQDRVKNPVSVSNKDERMQEAMQNVMIQTQQSVNHNDMKVDEYF